MNLLGNRGPLYTGIECTGAKFRLFLRARRQAGWAPGPATGVSRCQADAIPARRAQSNRESRSRDRERTAAGHTRHGTSTATLCEPLLTTSISRGARMYASPSEVSRVLSSRISVLAVPSVLAPRGKVYTVHARVGPGGMIYR